MAEIDNDNGVSLRGNFNGLMSVQFILKSTCSGI